MKYVKDKLGTVPIDVKISYLINGICFYESECGVSNPKDYRAFYYLTMENNNELDYREILKNDFGIEIIEV